MSGPLLNLSKIITHADTEGMLLYVMLLNSQFNHCYMRNLPILENY